MKSLKKSNLFTTAIIMLFTFGIIGFWGCENESIEDDTSLEYLDIENNFNSKTTEKDFKIAMQAIKRLDISKKSGLYVIQQTTGEQVNISNRLFNYIKQAFEYTNKLGKSKKNINQIARVNSGNPETDCVAHAVAHMGSGVSYEAAKAYIEANYGTNGVAPADLAGIVSHFYPNMTHSTNPPPSGNMNGAFIWFENGPGNGHAVNATWLSSNGNVWYQDHQNGGSGITSTADIKGYFYPN